MGDCALTRGKISDWLEVDLQDQAHSDGNVEKFKAWFVAKGFSQKEEVGYDKTFAPVARYTSIRVVISIVAEMGWKIHQMDVKTTFLNGIIEEEVYIEKP
jgi:hypothetical protein